MKAGVLGLAGVLAWTALSGAVNKHPKGYAHPELLVSAGWVARHESDPRVRLVDLRDAAAYAAKMGAR